MIVSVNWLKKYTDIDLPIDELATLIGARLVEIEEVIDLGKKYRGIIVAKVVSVKKHENADKLNVCLIDDGGRAQGVNRNEEGLVQVVCGAPNVREDMLVAWLPPKSTVPATYNDAEPFVLESRELRGVASNGMLASLKELDLGEDHSGILEVDAKAKPGDDFAKVYELNDYLLDIENKSLTHRPDCFGVIGLAREIAGIEGKKFETPEWLLSLEPYFDEKTETHTITPSVRIDNPELSSRYQAVVLSDANQGVKSPGLIQSYLARVGVRPINAIVDTTNYLMLTTGQPLHAFDYDKFIGLNNGKAEIVVRAAQAGETLKLLDGRIINLTPEDIIICSGETPVALAGAMGGSETEIDEHTKNILLESATFNLYNLRGTQMRHGIFSEAITRFTKGQPAELTAPVLASATRLIMSATGAKRVSDVIEAYPGKSDDNPIELTFENINQTLGKEYTQEHVIETLENVEFQVVPSAESLKVTSPYWRADIHILQDVIEEVGRLNGFDEITPSLPKRDFVAVEPSTFDSFRSHVRHTLARAGANEMYSYSFIPGDLMISAGQNPSQAFKITNALSPELEHYRLSLTPSLLARVYANSRQGFDEFALFEIGKSHMKDETVDGLPKEFDRLAFVYTDNRRSVQHKTAYYFAFIYLRQLLALLGLEQHIVIVPLENNDGVTNVYYQAGRSAEVYLEDVLIGHIGEYKKSVQKALKLPELTAGFELDLAALFKQYTRVKPNYIPLSRYQGTWQDICLQLAPDKTYKEVFEVIESVVTHSSFDYAISPVDIYQPEDKAYKNITLRIEVTDRTHTITNEEIKSLVEQIAKIAESQLQARIV